MCARVFTYLLDLRQSPQKLVFCRRKAFSAKGRSEKWTVGRAEVRDCDGEGKVEYRRDELSERNQPGGYHSRFDVEKRVAGLRHCARAAAAITRRCSKRKIRSDDKCAVYLPFASRGGQNIRIFQQNPAEEDHVSISTTSSLIRYSIITCYVP